MPFLSKKLTHTRTTHSPNPTYTHPLHNVPRARTPLRFSPPFTVLVQRPLLLLHPRLRLRSCVASVREEPRLRCWQIGLPDQALAPGRRGHLTCRALDPVLCVRRRVGAPGHEWGRSQGRVRSRHRPPRAPICHRDPHAPRRCPKLGEPRQQRKDVPQDLAGIGTEEGQHVRGRHGRVRW